MATVPLAAFVDSGHRDLTFEGEKEYLFQGDLVANIEYVGESVEDNCRSQITYLFLFTLHKQLSQTATVYPCSGLVSQPTSHNLNELLSSFPS